MSPSYHSYGKLVLTIDQFQPIQWGWSTSVHLLEKLKVCSSHSILFTKNMSYAKSVFMLTLYFSRELEVLSSKSSIIMHGVKHYFIKYWRRSVISIISKFIRTFYYMQIAGLGSVFMMPLIGNLSDAYGRKTLLTVPLVLSIIPLGI